MSDVLNISKLSNEDIETLFTDSYEEQVAKRGNITEFECKCAREKLNSSEVKVEVLISGMAGSPTLDDYKNGKVANSGNVIISIEGKGSLKFKLDPKNITALNTNDYLAVYNA